MLKIMSTLLCEILVAVSWVFWSYRGGSRITPWSQQAKKKPDLNSLDIRTPSNLPTQVAKRKTLIIFLLYVNDFQVVRSLFKILLRVGFTLLKTQPAVTKQPTDLPGVWLSRKLKWSSSGGLRTHVLALKRFCEVWRKIKADNWYPLTSYHMKTILFYECEAKPHPFLWGFDQLRNRLIEFLLRLEHTLITGFCPNYFMSVINQFESFPPEKRYRLTAEVQQLKNSLILAAESSYSKQSLVQCMYPPTPPSMPCAVIYVT